MTFKQRPCFAKYLNDFVLRHWREVRSKSAGAKWKVQAQSFPLVLVLPFSFSCRVLKWFKFAVSLLLLPVCAGAALALWKLLLVSGRADTTWIMTLAGAGCWLVLFFILPKPMWVYVFGHELTHALWSWLFGGRVKRMKVTSRGGHVIVTKTNFLVALAPYFFPLYAAIVVAIFVAGHLIWDWHSYLIVFHLFLGAAYAFHVTLTVFILQTRQTDITEQGYLFSTTIVFLGNAMVLLLGLPFLTAEADLVTVLRWWLDGTLAAFRFLAAALPQSAHAAL